jgi:hypothetical protein
LEFLKFRNKAVLIVKVMINVESIAIKIVIGIYEANFQLIQGRNIIGNIDIKVVALQLITGQLNSFNVFNIASFWLNHFFIFSDIHSTITIIVSIIIQNAIINEKFVITFREIPNKYNIINVKRNDNGKSIIDITLSLNHTKINNIKNTKINVNKIVLYKVKKSFSIKTDKSLV